MLIKDDSVRIPGSVTEGDLGERFGSGKRGNAASKFTAPIAVPGYTREIQRKANNRTVEDFSSNLSARFSEPTQRQSRFI